MSRSRRHSPFVGHTTAETDKPWKQQASRRLRRRVRQTLAGTLDGDALPEKRWAIETEWESMKDGKQRVEDASSKWLRK
ncbi:MAG TPA: hypothetical protein VFT61_02750 [Sphingomicrobium sp.]|nr:hypothetical protein [Sphingomicrobium sp.]